jgi:nuclear pore complex protein Nup54
MFGTPSSTPAFGTPSSTPQFGTPSSTPLFGTPSTPAFANVGFGSSLFSTPFTSQTQQQQQQQQTSLFQQPSTTGFGFQQQQTPFATPLQTTPFPPPPPPQLSTQMALVAPLPFSLADRDIQVCFPRFLGLNPNQDYFLFNMLIKLRVLIAGDCGCL